MRFEDQVCPLELAKKLKDLGVKQESLHWWGGIGNLGIWCDHVKEELPAQETRFTWYSAFTAAELGAMLPARLTRIRKNAAKISELVFELRLVKRDENIGGWYCDYVESSGGSIDDFVNPAPFFEGETEAEARAKMLIYLLENKLLNPKGR